jgi:hypothetical protein
MSPASALHAKLKTRLYGVCNEGSIVSLKAPPFCKPHGSSCTPHKGRRQKTAGKEASGVAGGVRVTFESWLFASRRLSLLMESYGSPGSQTCCLCLLEKIRVLVLQVLDRLDNGSVVDDPCAAVDHQLLIESRVPGKAQMGSEVSVLRSVKRRCAGAIAFSAEHVGDQRHRARSRFGRIALLHSRTEVLVETEWLGALQATGLVGD